MKGRMEEGNEKPRALLKEYKSKKPKTLTDHPLTLRSRPHKPGTSQTYCHPNID